MSKNKEIGNKGESVAVDYLLSQEYDVREVNYVSGKNEIDIICEKENTLVFVEVKTRRSTKFGLPEDSISSEKIDNILSCAGDYIEKIGWNGATRYDIISILIGRGYEDIEFNHIKDAFY